LETLPLISLDESLDAGPAQAPGWDSSHLANAIVAEQDRPGGGQEGRTVAHGVQQGIVRMRCTLDGESAIACGARDDQGVHTTGADGLECRFGLGQPGP